MTLLHGETIVLRPYRQNDAGALLAGANDPESSRLTGTQQTFTLEQIQQYIKWYDDPKDRAGFIIALPDTDEPIGEVVINEVDEDNRHANIRISLFRPNLFGKGYGTQAMKLMVDYGFRVMGLHRISLGVFAFNERAIGVYEKVGFQREGVLRDALFYEGAYHNEIIMSILEHEWTPL